MSFLGRTAEQQNGSRGGVCGRGEVGWIWIPQPGQWIPQMGEPITVADSTPRKGDSTSAATVAGYDN